MTNKSITATEQKELLVILKERFEKNRSRHKNIEWADVEKKIINNKQKLWSIHAMEKTGGEPDVVELKEGISYVDCSPESPQDRRSLCYDREAWEKRKANKPTDTALDMADAMGIDLLSEEDYRALQQLGTFDLKTSSWVLTPQEIRTLGGALFCDRRYDHVFTYHNGADSYYAARGFRGKVSIAL